MPATRRHNWLVIFSVWTAISFLLVIQVIVTTPTPETWHESLFVWLAQFLRGWLWALLTPAVFELRRLIVARHPEWAIAAGLHFLAALALMVWCNLIRAWALTAMLGFHQLEDYSFDMVWSVMSLRVLVDFFLYWFVLAAGYMVDLQWQKKRIEVREEQLRTALAEAELAALKQQVQPHFLFNSLNAISALMRENERDQAVETLAKLSQLMRALMLNAGQQEVELRRELDYVQLYLDIEKVRLQERLTVKFEIQEECLRALVPVLILQPLVENAIKHGIACRRSPGRITVTAALVGERLRLQVANDPAEAAKGRKPVESHGIGLATTRARLERTFGAAHRIETVINGPAGTVITLEFPQKYSAPAKPDHHE